MSTTNTVTWMRGNEAEQIEHLAEACPFCGKLALTRLPTWEQAKQKDGTNVVCNPALDGCNQGFEVRS